LGLIRQCVSAHQPGGGHMVEMIQAFLFGPVMTAETHVE
jgi:hypothetical protein